MDYRKLISFGKGGYVISVPKAWVNENKLQKGSFITLKDNGNSLILTPKENKEFVEKNISEHVIDVDNKRMEKLNRELVSAYLKSYDRIILKGEELKEKLPEITEAVHDLIALETIESTRDKLVLKDFLDFDTINVQQIFRKMDHLIRSMLNDILAKNYIEIENRKRDLDRHFFLIFKSIKKAMVDISVLKKLELTQTQLFIYWNNALVLESIADEMARLSRNLTKGKIKAETLNDLFNIITNLNETFTKTMSSFYKSDLESAYSFSSKKMEITSICDKLYNKHWKEKNVPILLEILKQIARHNHKILRRIYG
ncbi:MAG: phosphate uptake regulator PhoU [Nanoarchaeota archaeon]|nr:phosphate uptake regulator PhoU [Nanoarchaeota archaeon]